jgi:RNA polymerase sigma factor (sigma-70 family)
VSAKYSMMDRETKSPVSATASVEARFERLFRGTAPRVEAYVRRRVAAAAVDDVVAEIYLTAWRRIEELRGDPLPWLLGVARKVISTQSRARRRSEALVERVAFAMPSGSAADPWSPSLVLATLAQLSDIDREALLLIGWDGLTPAQAAKVLGISSAAFRVRLHRAKRRFAERFERERNREVMVADANPFPTRSIQCAQNVSSN